MRNPSKGRLASEAKHLEAVCNARAHHTLDLDPPTLFQIVQFLRERPAADPEVYFWTTLVAAQIHLLCVTHPRFALIDDSATFADLSLASLSPCHGHPWTDGQNLIKKPRLPRAPTHRPTVSAARNLILQLYSVKQNCCQNARLVQVTVDFRAERVKCL